MKTILSLLLLIIPSIVYGQIEFDQDTTKRPSKTTTVRPVVKDNNIYFIPKTGNAIQAATVLRSLSEFANHKQATAIYDGSTWVRTSGVTSSTTIGYGSMCTSSVSGFYYRRIVDSGINVKWFGVKGDGNVTTQELTRETIAMNKAIAFTCSQTNPAVFGSFSPYGSYSGTLIIPQGTYAFNDELLIPGSISIKMDEGPAYGGTKMIQSAPNKNLFHLKPDNDGNSSAVSITGGILINGSATIDMTKALIYGGVGTGEANNSSCYIQRVSFRTPQGWAVKIDQGDDIKVLDCTGDVISTSLFSFGSSTAPVTNLTISRTTMFDIAQKAIDLVNVRNASIIDNKMYQVDGNNLNNIFVNANGNISNLLIADNLTRNINTFCVLSSSASGFSMHHNNLQNHFGRLLLVTGGGVTYGANIDHNQITSATSFTTVSPIDIVGSGWQNSMIKDNSFFSLTGNATVPAIKMTDSRTINNQLYPNSFINFPTSYSINSPSSNGYVAPQGTVATQDANTIAITGGNITGVTLGSSNLNNVNITGLGSYSTTNTVTSSQYKLSTLNSAPSSASDTGTTGEIRFTATGIFICIATNTWIKATTATF